MSERARVRTHVRTLDNAGLASTQPRRKFEKKETRSLTHQRILQSSVILATLLYYIMPIDPDNGGSKFWTPAVIRTHVHTHYTINFKCCRCHRPSVHCRGLGGPLKKGRDCCMRSILTLNVCACSFSPTRVVVVVLLCVVTFFSCALLYCFPSVGARLTLRW